MASVDNPDDPTLDPGNQDPALQTGTAGGGTTPASGTAPAVPSVGGSSALGSGQGDTSNVAALNQGSNFQPLLDNLAAQGTTAKSDLNASENAFATSLGIAPVFGDTDRTTLGGAIKDATQVPGAQNLINTQYTGPSGIDLSQFNTDAANYSNNVRQTQSQGGIAGLLQGMFPQETQGETAFDANIFGADPAFQTAAGGLVNDANTTLGLGQNAPQQALDAITGYKTGLGTYNTAGKGYVGDQINTINSAVGDQVTAANKQDTDLQALLTAIKSGQSKLSDAAPTSLSFDPSTYGTPQSFTSKYGSDVFNETVDPSSYLSYAAGQTPTTSNVMTQDEATQLNNANAILSQNNVYAPGSRTGGQLGFNSAALQQAIANAQSGLSAADKAYLLAHQPAAPTGGATPPDSTGVNPDSGGGGGPPGPGTGDSGDGGDGGGDGEAMGGFVRPTRNSAAAPNRSIGISATPRPRGFPSSSAKPRIHGMPSQSVGPIAVSPAAAGLQSAIPTTPTSMASSYAEGGVVDTSQDTSARANLLAAILRTSQPAPPVQAPVQTQHGLIARYQGGPVPYKGFPAGRDTVPTNTTRGEYVVKQPSVKAVGADVMTRLNHIDRLPPAAQHIARRALHAALVRSGA